MATWDGSCHEPEDSNYFFYSGQNSAIPNVESWTFYPSNGSNVFFHSTHAPYSQNTSMMLGQSEHIASCQTDANFSSGSLNSLPLRDTCPDYLNAPGSTQDCQGNSRSQNMSTYYYQSNRQGKRIKNYKDNNKYEFPKEVSRNNCSIVEHSNLHPTASEFVPHGIKHYANQANTNLHVSNSEDSKPNLAQETYVSDNGGKYKKKYNTKKNNSYKYKEMPEYNFRQRNSFQNSYKTQHGRNYRKYQNTSEEPASMSNHHRNNSTTDETQKNEKFMNINTNINANKTNASNIEEKHEVNDQARANKENTDASSTISQNCDHSSKNNYQRHNSNFGTQRIPAKYGRKVTNDRKIGRYDNNYRERKNNYQEYNNYKERYEESKIDITKDKYKNKDVTQETKEVEIVNWRQKGEGNDRNSISKRKQNKKHEDDDASQRERLTDQLNKGQLECLVCCEYIKQNDYIWSCSNCYHVLHLKCIKKWAKSSQAENGWRCPACQNVSTTIPEEYFCFCGKTNMPEWNRRDMAHSCGEVCGRSRIKNNCPHKCTLLCHPGSCPSCIAMVTKNCGCGKTSQTLQCCALTLLLCDSVCGKILNCGKHTCEKKCHHGECEPCDKIIQQECYCGKSKRDVICQSNISSTYSCEDTCEKLLDCGNHKCKKTCHPNSCEPCALTPEKITTCYCGRTPLSDKRTTCLDPIPTCEEICSKRLNCGQPSNPHTCKIKCHQGDCPECDLTTDVKCRCGNMDREIPCKDLTTKADDARCEKKCIKKRSCGKHKCNQMCCIDLEHICPLPCSKTLSCGRHKCEQTCHKGRCQPCWRSSFDELYCECGTAVIYPPVPCGTRRPVCDRPCSRDHSCGHEVFHNCHSEPSCPPCTYLTEKWCYGKHELRKAVPCYFNEISCGLLCNKPLSCGRHKCITICHPGSCEKPGQQCVQPCNILRELCGHICAAPCHEGKCPDTPCKEMVKVTCQCGHRSTTRVCAENSREYQRITSNILASKMADMQLGHSVDLEELFGPGAKKQNQLKILECSDECKLIERNRRLALGLQIVNPDLSGKLMPRYTDYMKQWAKKDPHFCQMVHEKLTELVQLAKTSKQKSRSYSFDSMNRDKRRFIHESCEHFGCESQAYDLEPKRNVVATAVKDKCWLPSYSLLEIVQRNNGQRKVPGPILNTSKANNSTKTILALPITRSQQIVPTPSTSKSPEPEIDYFDYKG
ncbi:protein shuttle craft isoform X1 [Vespula pensylvanica]|uniref:protein shuttle craft isoform X1 n=2 Tax=Vespula pensylvanica TaxID=30213 RepID=UPI001CBA236A|nr:protein shuttle craft isoform X1 [Vespula pensylvanica]XP_043669082.1 protein shuttle craft isoform X1 [Vespula pensylvanica]